MQVAQRTMAANVDWTGNYIFATEVRILAIQAQVKDGVLQPTGLGCLYAAVTMPDVEKHVLLVYGPENQVTDVEMYVVTQTWEVLEQLTEACPANSPVVLSNGMGRTLQPNGAELGSLWIDPAQYREGVSCIYRLTCLHCTCIHTSTHFHIPFMVMLENAAGGCVFWVRPSSA